MNILDVQTTLNPEFILVTQKFLLLEETRSGFDELTTKTSDPTYDKDYMKFSVFDEYTVVVLGMAKETSIFKILI